MLERIRSQPWMAATIVLAVALVVSLALLFTRSPSGEPGDDATATSTTEPLPGASTTDPSDEPPVGGELLSVVVDNAPLAQPQVGIAAAAVLVEYPVEGGITRFNALLESGASGLIGPVRSLRPVNTPPALGTDDGGGLERWSAVRVTGVDRSRHHFDHPRRGDAHLRLPRPSFSS
ncbi:MAG TPA: DUF3048 domain-containing protein [Acidimicrobiia bacterium]|nr:DUF3048 domain-containing protein [Acidimicrobiia bacterium]